MQKLDRSSYRNSIEAGGRFLRGRKQHGIKGFPVSIATLILGYFEQMNLRSCGKSHLTRRPKKAPIFVIVESLDPHREIPCSWTQRGVVERSTSCQDIPGGHSLRTSRLPRIFHGPRDRAWSRSSEELNRNKNLFSFKSSIWRDGAKAQALKITFYTALG